MNYLEYWSIEIVGGVLFCNICYENFFMGERCETFFIKQATLGM